MEAAALALAFATMITLYCIVTGAMSWVEANALRRSTRQFRFENDLRELQAHLWHTGLDLRISTDLLISLAREARELLDAIGTRPLEQLAQQAARLEERGRIALAAAGRAPEPRRFPAPVPYSGDEGE
jgi:hypothetical protein